MSDDKMSAYECFQEYMALKNHFTQKNYDYFKYNGKTRVTFQSFESRKDKLFFQKVAKHSDPKNYILSNLLENNKAWIKDIAYSKTAEEIYQQWSKRVQSLSYNFKNECSKLLENFDDNFKVKSNHPYLIRLYLSKEICLETLIILVDTVKCMPYWNNKMSYDPVWEETADKIIKYRPFLKYDQDKIKQILLDKFSE